MDQFGSTVMAVLAIAAVPGGPSGRDPASWSLTRTPRLGGLADELYDVTFTARQVVFNGTSNKISVPTNLAGTADVTVMVEDQHHVPAAGTGGLRLHRGAGQEKLQYKIERSWRSGNMVSASSWLGGEDDPGQGPSSTTVLDHRLDENVQLSEPAQWTPSAMCHGDRRDDRQSEDAVPYRLHATQLAARTSTMPIRNRLVSIGERCYDHGRDR